MTTRILELRDNPSRMQLLDEREFEVAWQQLVDLSKDLDDLQTLFLKEYIRRANIKRTIIDAKPSTEKK